MKRKNLAIALALILPALLPARQAAAGPTAYLSQAGNSVDFSQGQLILGSGIANCTAATTGAIRYNSATPRIEFCNGTSWQMLVQTQTSGITAPAGSGYFVLSHDTYNGNLGGLTGADAKCLTDLTTNTGWMGYSTANSNGQLVASKVHAFLCAVGSCNGLMPLTTYYFANGGNAAAGGGSFTTDSSGFGPGDSNNWSAANYFSASNRYWSARAASGSVFSNTYDNAGACSNTWVSSSSGTSGDTGNSTSTGSGRWQGTTFTCDNSLYLVCYVNP